MTIESSWEGAGGIPGIFEGLFAPLGLRRIYGEMLDKLAGALAQDLTRCCGCGPPLRRARGDGTRRPECQAPRPRRRAGH